MAADRFFQKPSIMADIAEVKAERDIDDFIFTKLNSL